MEERAAPRHNQYRHRCRWRLGPNDQSRLRRDVRAIPHVLQLLERRSWMGNFRYWHLLFHHEWVVSQVWSSTCHHRRELVPLHLLGLGILCEQLQVTAGQPYFRRYWNESI